MLRAASIKGNWITHGRIRGKQACRKRFGGMLFWLRVTTEWWKRAISIFRQIPPKTIF